MAAISSSIPLINNNKKNKMSLPNGGGSQEQFLLERIGGSASLKLAVDEFYTLLMKDEMLSPFFRAVNIHKIKWHVSKADSIQSLRIRW